MERETILWNATRRLRQRGRGRPPHPDVLTPAEWDVAHRVRHGFSNRRIAVVRETSLDATKFHVANILDKLGLDSRKALRLWPGRPAELRRRTGEKEAAMAELKLGTLGQVSLQVSDAGEAERFYRDVLGLPHLYTFGNLVFFDLDGPRLFLSAEDENVEGVGSSVLYFSVDDIHASWQALEAKGVRLEGAPHLIHRWESGLEEWMGFFRDPFGNLLALMARIQGTA